MQIDQNISPATLQSLTTVQARKYRVVPIENGKDALHLYVDGSSFNDIIHTELTLIKQKSIKPVSIESTQIDILLDKYYRQQSNSGQHSVSVSIDKAESFLDDLVKEAKDLGGSDIHIETYEDKCRIRLRIDGRLIEKYELKQSDYPSLINKLKIKANLDIAEKRLPQDGRIHYTHHQDTFDLRVSILPSMYGEKAVLRILSQDSSRLDLRKIGLPDDSYETYLDSIKNPDGIILISGPTGSGKTTTLYATLKELNDVGVNICTVEDPIEYTLEGINQVQVKSSIGLTFASALRSFLRQDPDIIMLGEIRDGETAEMAVRASLTGHLVLSTIHTNSAVDTLLRLVDMGVPSFLIASTLKLSVAQRLVRKLCPSCKTEAPKNDIPPQIQNIIEEKVIFQAKGCSHCFYTGYKGRIALYEVLRISEEIQEAIKTGQNLKRAIPQNHMQLSDHALHILIEGHTSVDEVYPLINTTA